MKGVLLLTWTVPKTLWIPLFKQSKTQDIKLGSEVMIALDCAAAEFYKDGVYDYTLFEGDKGVKRTSEEQASLS